MKIAIPTDNRKTLAERTGRAKEFAVYEIENGEIVSVNFAKNTHEHHDHDEGQNHDHSHAEIVDALEGVDILLVSIIGKHMKADLESAGINYQRISKTNIDDILSEYLD